MKKLKCYFALSVLMFLSVGLWSCAFKKQTTEGIFNSAHGVRAIIDKGDIQRIITADGTLFSPSSKVLSVQRVRWYWDYTVLWTAEEGSRVKAGDVVVKLDPGTIMKDLEDRRSALSEAKLNLEETKVQSEERISDAEMQIKQADFQVKKSKLMVSPPDTVSANERKKQLLDVAAAESALRRAQERVTSEKIGAARALEAQRIRVKQAQDEVEEMLGGLERMQLRAPQDGILIFPQQVNNQGVAVKARPGVPVQAGSVIVEIANPDDLVARLFVPEVDGAGLQVDLKGEAFLDVLPGVKFSGKVTKVASLPSTVAEREGQKSPTPAEQVRQIEVWFAFDHLKKDDLPGLSGPMPGMGLRVSLQTQKKEGVLRCPLPYLRTAQQLSPHYPVVPLSSEVLEQSKGGAVAYVLAQATPSGQGARAKPDAWEWRQVLWGATGPVHAEILAGVTDGTQLKWSEND